MLHRGVFQSTSSTNNIVTVYGICIYDGRGVCFGHLMLKATKPETWFELN